VAVTPAQPLRAVVTFAGGGGADCLSCPVDGRPARDGVMLGVMPRAQLERLLAMEGPLVLVVELVSFPAAPLPAAPAPTVPLSPGNSVDSFVFPASPPAVTSPLASPAAPPAPARPAQPASPVGVLRFPSPELLASQPQPAPAAQAAPRGSDMIVQLREQLAGMQHVVDGVATQDAQHWAQRRAALEREEALQRRHEALQCRYDALLQRRYEEVVIVSSDDDEAGPSRKRPREASEAEVCPVCWDAFGPDNQRIASTGCGHSICGKCCLQMYGFSPPAGRHAVVSAGHKCIKCRKEVPAVLRIFS
jgi:hypothetical protein